MEFFFRRLVEIFERYSSFAQQNFLPFFPQTENEIGAVGSSGSSSAGGRKSGNKKKSESADADLESRYIKVLQPLQFLPFSAECKSLRITYS